MNERSIARHNAKVEARIRMQGKKQVHIRPLKFHVLRVWLDDGYPHPVGGVLNYNFTYLQQGRQWKDDVYATDELDAWRKAKADLKAGSCYLGRRYYVLGEQ